MLDVLLTALSCSGGIQELSGTPTTASTSWDKLAAYLHNITKSGEWLRVPVDVLLEMFR